MNRNGKFYFIIILIGLPILFYLFLFSQKQIKLHERLEKEGYVDTALIVREFIGAKGNLYFEYLFYLNDRNYNGFIKYSPSHGDIAVGDSFLVKYLYEDPDEVNELIKNKDHKLIRIER